MDMRSYEKTTPFCSFLRNSLLAALVLTASLGQAATLWTGPNIGFIHNVGDPSDQIVAGVALSRNANGPLFNTAAGESASDFVNSPTDTMWAFGTLGNYSNLTYKTFPAIRSGASFDLALALLNKPMVLHLVDEDIYIAVTFTNWSRNGLFSGVGSFGYTRSTAPAATPPTVSITNPTNNATFVAPANVNLTANATVTGGTVTNVTYRAGANVLGSATASPFSVTASNLAAGPYVLTAVATAGGLSTTSAVVNFTVVNAGSILLSSPHITVNQFIFSYTANPGLSYVLQSSPTLSNWTSLSTNIAAGSLVTVTNPLAPSGAVNYRVGRLP